MARSLQRIEYVHVVLGVIWYPADLLVPTLLSTLVLTIFVVGVFESNGPHHAAYLTSKTSTLGMLAYSVFTMLLSLPSVIITYR